MKEKSTVERLHEYWCNPDDGMNSPYNYVHSPRVNERSVSLLKFIKRKFPDKDISILEIGSGTGRNLHYLQDAGYQNISGIEISLKYISAMNRYFPRLSDRIIQGPVEEILPRISNRYDIVFTMAVLEHIPTESEYIFKDIVRVADQLLTIEDEFRVSWRHFPRNYREVFSSIGMDYLGGWKNIKGFSDKFIMRHFKQRND